VITSRVKGLQPNGDPASPHTGDEITMTGDIAVPHALRPFGDEDDPNLARTPFRPHSSQDPGRSDIPARLLAQQMAVRASGPWARILSAFPPRSRPMAARLLPVVATGMLCFLGGFLVARGTSTPPPPPEKAPGTEHAAGVVVPHADVPAVPVAAEAPSPTPAPPAMDCVASISSKPSAAFVTWGESRIGRTPLRAVQVPCGPATVVLKRGRFGMASVFVDARPETSVEIDERLKRPQSWLDVSSDPSGARLRLNQRWSGTTPNRVRVFQGDTLIVRLFKPGFAPFIQRVRVGRQETQDLAANLTPMKAKRPVPRPKAIASATVAATPKSAAPPATSKPPAAAAVPTSPATTAKTTAPPLPTAKTPTPAPATPMLPAPAVTAKTGATNPAGSPPRAPQK
jgi:hypothetical protein